jgi:hypothetical protein
MIFSPFLPEGDEELTPVERKVLTFDQKEGCRNIAFYLVAKGLPKYTEGCDDVTNYLYYLYRSKRAGREYMDYLTWSRD